MARSAQQGTIVTLYIQILDRFGVLQDSEIDPTVSIYDFDSDPRQSGSTTAEAIVLNASQTSLGAVGQQGIYLMVREAQGIYSYQYDIALDAHVGTWFDVWTFTLDGAAQTFYGQWNTLASASTTDPNSIVDVTNTLLMNNVIIVTLDASIAATDGSTLGEDFEYYFTTKYNPLHATTKQVRVRAGAYLQTVPDDTINLAIFEASREADAITFGLAYDTSTLPVSYELPSGEIAPTYAVSRIRSGPYMTLARRNYAICMAIWMLLKSFLLMGGKC